jgi:hypothetical protein
MRIKLIYLKASSLARTIVGAPTGGTMKNSLKARDSDRSCQTMMMYITSGARRSLDSKREKTVVDADAKN